MSDNNYINMEVEAKVPVIKKKVKEVGIPPTGTGEAPAIEVKKSFLRNTSGKEVCECEYFFSEKGPKEGKAPAGFAQTCGKPVDREDLLGVFNKIFKPEDNILFYKQTDKEVYLVIVPLKYSASVGGHNGSMEGDFQKHAISFLTEGSVNLDTLKMKLKRIIPFVRYSDR